MITTSTLQVSRDHIGNMQIVSATTKSVAELAPGEMLLRIELFALTANNISYAAMGNSLHYWDFFPAEDAASGIVPVWGFATVLGSRSEDAANEEAIDGLNTGERFFGYFPMSTHLIVKPVAIDKTGFSDSSTHRSALPVFYNRYIRCASDALYSADTEAQQMLFRPLFTTSFLLDDFFGDQKFFDAKTLVLTSASSKTALGVAYLLKYNRAQRSERYNIVGLTSPANVAFVESMDCYDRVLSYDQLEQLGAGCATASIDFAGSAQLLARLHKHLAEQLKYSCLVGASHWQETGSAGDLPGPQPEFFFAPTQAQTRMKELGPAEFQQRVAALWLKFIAFSGTWMRVEEHYGADAVTAVYARLLEGNFSPDRGFIVSLWGEISKPS